MFCTILAVRTVESRPQLYRQFFTQREIRMLDSTPADQASNEISLLRVLLMRLLAATKGAHGLNLKDRLEFLSACSASGLILASLVRFESKYHNPSDAWADSLFAAMAEMDPYDL